MVDPLGFGTVDLLAVGRFDPLRTAATALKTLILLSGGAITWYAYRAYRRTESSAVGALAVGFGFVTTGALLAGVVDQLLALSRNLAVLIESGFTAGGFLIVLWSLFRR